MSFVNVVLDLSELLNSPLADINKRLDLLSGVCVKSCYRRCELRGKLRVILEDKVKDIDDLTQSQVHLWRHFHSFQKVELSNQLLCTDLVLFGPEVVQ